MIEKENEASKGRYDFKAIDFIIGTGTQHERICFKIGIQY